MSKGEFLSKLLTLDAKLAVQTLKNDLLVAKLKTDTLLRELNLKVK